MGHYVNTGVRVSMFDQSVVESLSNQILMNNGFTEKQMALAIKLCKKYHQQLQVHFRISVSHNLDSPQNRIPLRVFKTEKTVKVVTTQLGKMFEVQFPYDRILIEKMRSFKAHYKNSHAQWNDAVKNWHLSFDETSIKFIIEELSGFTFDDTLTTFIEEYNKICSNFANHVIMLTKKDGQYVTTNLKNGIEEENILTALVEARHKQIPVISDEVISDLGNTSVSSITKSILGNPDKYLFQSDKRLHRDLDILNGMLMFNRPIGVVMNSNCTSSDLLKWVDTVTAAGIDLSEVGVFFRLENSTPEQKEFNNLIKQLKLNKPVSKDLKIFFLGPKYNKSLLKEGVALRYFICDDHQVTAHHNMQTMLQNSLLTIYHLAHEKKLGDHFVIL